MSSHDESPLAQLKVLELANILAGPLVGQFCAELGADVIKVEQPGLGDPTRGWYLATESHDSDVSAYFSCANWGKRSIAIDIATTAGRELVYQLVDLSDVVIVGYKPGDEVKFGLDYKSVAARNPQLIYLQVTAYGASDLRPGFDAIIQAESGFTYLNGEAGGGPVKMPVALVDLLAAHQLKEGLLLALLQRAQTGRGAYIATSLLAAATASLANQASNYLHAGVVPVRMGSEHPNIVPYGTIFHTSDARELVIAVGTQRQFVAFVAALDLAELSEDERFIDNAARVANRDVLNDLLAARIAERSAATVAVALQADKVPFGFVNNMAQVFAAPEAARQLFAAGGGVRTVALQGDFAGSDSLAPPPHLDEHRAEILALLAQ
ncbi:MAG: CaiB/BaiF CoA-transferase family protein [Pseudomonadales bacterium]